MHAVSGLRGVSQAEQDQRMQQEIERRLAVIDYAYLTKIGL